MNTKLTLSLKKEVIEQAKTFAKEKNLSLSSIVENFLQKLLNDFNETPAESVSIVDELSGVLSLEADFDYKDDWAKHMFEKHS